jgi:flagellar assembly factor FliW
MFGTIDVQENQEIRFVQPVIGFPGLLRYVLIDSGSCIKWLQSIEDPAVTFPVVDPFSVKAEYDIEIPTAEAEALEVNDVAEVQLYAITVLSRSEKEVRANLRAPVVMNRRTGKAKQVVLADNDLPIRYSFLPQAAESNKEVAQYVGANA